MATLKELRESRLDKLRKLKELGIDPYPAKSYKSIENQEIHNLFENLEGKTLTAAGRLLSIREHGPLAFLDIKDHTGKVQLYVKSENLVNAIYQNSELNFTDIKLLDAGDFVEGEGIVTKTQRGEISIEVTKVRILTKSIRPMPNAWDGLHDKETRLRRRYLDTNMNQEVYERFLRRAKFWEAHREFFKKNGFVEMNIPVLEAVTGGADANPFITHMDAIDTDFYLRISQELYLKRLIGGGYNKVYEIGPRFRNEGISDEHLPEHIAMEYYWAYANYKDGMEFTKELFRYVYENVYGKLKFQIKGFEVDLAKEWEIIDYSQVIKEGFNIDVFNTNLDEIKTVLHSQKVSVDKNLNINRGIDTIWKLIRKTIGGPAFMVNEPKFLSPLAKSSPDKPQLTERFHPMIAGSELGNAFSELNDPIDQLNRFMEQQKLRETGDSEAHMLDIDFVEMLEYGMPPTFGYGHSERNFWFFEDVPAREGVPFPQLRHEIDDVTKGIYPQIYNNTLSVETNDNSSNSKITPSKSEQTPNQDFTKKIVIVVNKVLEPWQITNAISHVSAYIGNKLQEKFVTGETFITEDGKNHPRNSQYPIVVLTAKPGQMSNFITAVRESGLLYHGFIREMIETTNDEEIAQRLQNKKDTEIEYLAIGLFGDNEKVNVLTKKFSLFK